MSKRLGILKNSLAKKEQEFSNRLNAHMNTVKQANGQPLNDKRNGRATISQWDRQNNALRTLNESIEKTKRAIEAEEGKIAGIVHVNTFIPTEILELVESGELNQWRKYPHIFFVSGVEKARIIWDNKAGVVAHKYVNAITEQEQRSKFVKIYNQLNAMLNAA